MAAVKHHARQQGQQEGQSRDRNGLLLELREGFGPVDDKESADALRKKADASSHELIVARLAQARPDDCVLSEEGADDLVRLEAERVWIVDPLDGTWEYGQGRVDFAVHVSDRLEIEVLGLERPERLGQGRLVPLGQLAGANVYQFAGLPNNSESLAGFACGADAIAVASALPMTEIPGWEVANATDPDTGLSVQIIMGQEQSGLYNITATMLFGASVGRAGSLVRLKTA